jgi:hypothetical protein
MDTHIWLLFFFFIADASRAQQVYVSEASKLQPCCACWSLRLNYTAWHDPVTRIAIIQLSHNGGVVTGPYNLHWPWFIPFLPDGPLHTTFGAALGPGGSPWLTIDQAGNLAIWKQQFQPTDAQGRVQLPPPDKLFSVNDIIVPLPPTNFSFVHI